MREDTHTTAKDEPTRWQALAFAGKAWVHRVRRMVADLGGDAARLDRTEIDSSAPILAQSVSPLFSTTTGAEFALQAGKIHNLRKAAACLNGLRIPQSAVFSFWKHIPRPTKRGGYAPGRELREGCVIPSIGGGLCQLTNALYAAALDAGFEIVERHAHSRILPGSMAEAGRDATVFWNYVDLRYRAPSDVQLEVRISRTKLTVAFRQTGEPCAKSRPASPAPIAEAAPEGPAAESCETCGVTSCFRNPSATSLPQRSATAWLVDAHWPEHDRYVSENRGDDDTLLLPLNSRRYGIGPYRWDTRKFAHVIQFPWFVARRSLASRRLASQGAARQRTLLAMDDRLAGLYERRIPYTALHIVVSQNLLPFLWRSGALGGRSFDVLMTRLPLAEIESQLDRAARVWPESSTLADFRADPALVTAETEALAAAERWITPHTAVAALAGCRAHILPWALPASEPRARGGRIVFPASTLARKGAWDIRQVARDLSLPITLGGPVIEDREFWSGCSATRAEPDDWMRDAALIVLPAWVENQPRRLLAAVAAGIPVIATDACGITGMPGVTIVPTGEPSALAAVIEAERATHAK